MHKDTKNGEQFGKAYANPLSKKGLTPQAVAVYGYLAIYRDANNESYPGRRRMAQELHMSQRTVSTAIEILTRAGIITVDETKRQTHTYILHDGNGKPGEYYGLVVLSMLTRGDLNVYDRAYYVSCTVYARKDKATGKLMIYQRAKDLARGAGLKERAGMYKNDKFRKKKILVPAGGRGKRKFYELIQPVPGKKPDTDNQEVEADLYARVVTRDIRNIAKIGEYLVDLARMKEIHARAVTLTCKSGNESEHFSLRLINH